MAGSSAFQFGRAAYKAGLIIAPRSSPATPGRTSASACAARPTRRTDALRERVGEMLEGVRVRDLQRLAPDVLAGVLPRLYPQMLELAYAHQDAGRPIFICTAASQEMAELMAIVLTFDGAVGSRLGGRRRRLHRPRRRPVHLPRGQGAGDPRARRARGHRPRRVLGLLATRESDLPMLRARRPSGRRQPGRGAGARRARGGLGGPALRAARAGGCASPARRRWPPLGGVGSVGARAVGAGRRAACRAPMSLHELTDEQREIRALARRFADEQIAPHAARVGPRAPLPARAVRRARRARADGRLRAGGARRRGRGLPRLRARARGALARRRRRRRDRRRAHQRGHAADPRPRHRRADRALVPPLARGEELGGVRADRVRARARTPARCARAPPTAASPAPSSGSPTARTPPRSSSSRARTDGIARVRRARRRRRLRGHARGGEARPELLLDRRPRASRTRPPSGSATPGDGHARSRCATLDGGRIGIAAQAVGIAQAGARPRDRLRARSATRSAARSPASARSSRSSPTCRPRSRRPAR